MKRLCTILTILIASTSAHAQQIRSNIPYVNGGHARQVLDIHLPKEAKNVPVIFWIHGGGWQAGDKTSVQLKPKAFTDSGFVFVSTNYRLLPDFPMEAIVADIGSSLAWVHQHIAEFGGDPGRIFVMGHSAGAQLAALVSVDDRILKPHKVPLSVIKGCVPVDGDTFDIPAIIETAETRRRVHHLPQAKFGHREKFGNTAEKHRDFSTVTHVAKGKNIPPFLIMHVADHPDTSAQAARLANSLKAAGITANLYGAKESTHSRINEEIGRPGDPGTVHLFNFINTALAK